VPPKINFETPIFHANVREADGSVCADILHSEWSAALTIGAALLSLVSLLNDPEPEYLSKTKRRAAASSSLSDYERQNLFQLDRDAYERKAKIWTQKYAMA
jgi:ubiquitin-protein ligase